MTMGFRNRPTPGRARYDASPTTGRFVAGIVCGATILAGFWILPMVALYPLAAIGFSCAIFMPEMFE